MPAEPAQTELDQLAFEIFAQRVAGLPANKGTRSHAIAAYRQATDFVAVRQAVKAGELSAKPPTGPQLADCCAPNLPATHPLNMVSARYEERKHGNATGRVVKGDLGKVQKIAQWLLEHPTATPDQFDIAFPNLNWDGPQLNVARDVFPSYLPKKAVA